jgi:voltage-gated potassium channel
MMMNNNVTPRTVQHSNAYNIFILVLTILSLAVMVVLVLPILSPATQSLLNFYDNLICIIFLIDFYINIRGSSPKSQYFIKQRGWLDLLGSIPSFGFFQYAALFRLFRLSRLARVTRLLRGQNRKALVEDVVKNRSQYVAFLTVLLTILVLTIASVLVLQFESKSPDANITTGWNSFWYSIVTITTVGYGDFYPVTFGGRVTAMFIMFMGVGIIGVLASLLSSLLVGPTPSSNEEPAPNSLPASTVEQELAAIQDKLAAMQQMIEKLSASGGSGT